MVEEGEGEESVEELDVMGGVEELFQTKVVQNVSSLEEKYRDLNKKLKID